MNIEAARRIWRACDTLVGELDGVNDSMRHEWDDGVWFADDNGRQVAISPDGRIDLRGTWHTHELALIAAIAALVPSYWQANQMF